MARRPSILSDVLAKGADKLAERWKVPPENVPAFRDAFDAVVRDAFKLYGGDRIYVAERSVGERQAQRRRILDALAGKEDPAAIARREGVTVRWVRVLKAKAQGVRNE